MMLYWLVANVAIGSIAFSAFLGCQMRAFSKIFNPEKALSVLAIGAAFLVLLEKQKKRLRD